MTASNTVPRTSPTDPQHALTPTPPLGWNSFDCYGLYAYDESLRSNLEAMAEKLAPAGYEYFVVDSGWFGEFAYQPGTRYPLGREPVDVHLDAYGLYEPSRIAFPAGLQPLIDRCHALGLKFGLHLMRGIPRKAVKFNTPIPGSKARAGDIAMRSNMCPWSELTYGIDMTRPGAQAYYDALIAKLAGWGVDFIKYDDITAYPDEIQAVRKAIDRCGRPIVLSLSPGGNTDPRHMETYRQANMLRITKDIWDRHIDIERSFDAWEHYQGEGGHGVWMDLDMIPFGQLQMLSPACDNPEQLTEAEMAMAGLGYRRWCELSQPQKRTFITMRALAASPLMVGGDLPSLDPDSLALLTHQQMLACNQNGVIGRRVHRDGELEIWRTPDQSTSHRGWLGLFNRCRSQPRSLTLRAELLGISPGTHLTDIWAGRALGPIDPSPQVTIAPDDVLFLAYDGHSRP